jgi:hypothetical protein
MSAVPAQSKWNNMGNVQTDSTKSQLSSAERQFSKFLVKLNADDPVRYPYKEFYGIPHDEFRSFRDVFGMYPDYLRQENLMLNTVWGYMSAIHGYICKKCPQSDINGSWYGSVRDATEKMFKKQARDTNTRVSNPAAPMSSQDLKLLCKILFIRGDTLSFQQRCLLVLQWQALGRVSEITSLTFASVEWYDNFKCLNLTMNRDKVGLEHTIGVFLHCREWLLCPIHAVASMIAMGATSSDRLFPFVPESNAASHVNSLLSALCAAAQQDVQLGMEFSALCKKLTSHSPRSGATTEANENPEMQLHWCIAGADAAKKFCELHQNLPIPRPEASQSGDPCGDGSAAPKRRRTEGCAVQKQSRERSIQATLESMLKRLGELQQHYGELFEPLLRPNAEPVSTYARRAQKPARARPRPRARAGPISTTGPTSSSAAAASVAAAPASVAAADDDCAGSDR